VVAVSRAEFRGLARELRPVQVRRRSALLAVAGWVWRHLPEIVAGFLMLRAWSWAARSIGPTWTALVATALVVAAVGCPWSRRWLLAALGCWVTRHRLYTAMVEVRLSTRAGRLPLFLAVVPTPVGERAWLWCRAGISAEDMADEIDRIRAALAARDVRITRDRRWAALVVVEVIRRDPLAASAIRSPLADLLSKEDGE
jgi:hypothetical protein